MTDTTSPLPVLYARWARELLGGDPPNETRATCLDCAMAAPPGIQEAHGVSFFNPHTKCCTYTPALPNFLAGGILADESPGGAQGRASVLQRIAVREGVTPLGLGRPAAVDAVYAALAPERFGSDMSMRCPHMTSDDLCGIWRHRNSVCATWFCKHERGAVGQRFWDHTREWLRALERELAVWCVSEAGWESSALAALLTLERPPWTDVARLVPSEPPDPWGAWAGREAEFYVDCWRRADAMPADAVLAACGATTAARASVMKEMFRRLCDESIPDRLVQAPLVLVRRNAASSVVLTYRGSDMLELEDDALRVVQRFDGRPTEEVLRALAEDDGLEAEPDLVRHLHDFEILRDPADG